MDAAASGSGYFAIDASTGQITIDASAATSAEWGDQYTNLDFYAHITDEFGVQWDSPYVDFITTIESRCMSSTGVPTHTTLDDTSYTPSTISVAVLGA